MTERQDPTAEVTREVIGRAVADLRTALERVGEAEIRAVEALAHDVLAAWDRGGKLLVAGNGGSAADSQHIVAELVGRFYDERPAWAALALTTNTSTLTAVGNDYGFDSVFARQVQGLGNPQDVLLVISTSGNSANCLAAVDEARRRGLRVHGFLGGTGGRLAESCDSALIAPSDQTPRIQEIHITMGHVLCQVLERLMADRAAG
jgi:D-sedoheptulose 7-phosphate isomerase